MQEKRRKAMNEKCCDTCKHYSALREPRERPDGAIIYGYCFKSGDKDYSPFMGKGYPVFIDGGGCACEEYKRKKAINVLSPAADVEPVRHGRWERGSSSCDPFCEVWTCSFCGSENEPGARYNYCPSCGAKMDGEAEK